MLKLVKNKNNGQPMLYGIFSNRYQDRDREIITDLAHKDYISWLDQNPQAAPKLWIWHDETTEFKNQAVWWAYDGAFVSMLWPLEQSEADTIKRLENRFGELGMSHGFQADKRGGLILKYRTYEASILPKEKAANFFTDVNLMEDTNKMDEKTMAKLASFTDDELAHELAKRQADMAEALDDSGVVTKEADQVEATEPEAVEVETEPETADEVEPTVEADDIIALANVVGDLVQQFAEFRANVEGEIKALKTADAKRKAKAAPKTVKSVIRDIAALSKSAVGTAKPVDGRTTAAKAKPTAPKVDYDDSSWSVTSMRGGA